MQAQAPQKFNYQAVVRDGSSNPLANTIVSLRISINKYVLFGDTTMVYSETHTATSNSQGIVTLFIGRGNSEDSFSEIDWSLGKFTFLRLKVEMDAAGGTDYKEYSESQLVSVPYALHATTAIIADTAKRALIAKKAETVDTVKTIKDADGDTRIETEKYSDEDNIHIYTGGEEQLIINEFGEIYHYNANSVAFGLGTHRSLHGTYCAAFGSYALGKNAGGHFNSSFGCNSSPANTSGARNAALGFNSLYSNTQGSYNTALGCNSGTKNTIGSYNTIIGYEANTSDTNLYYATAIGYGAKVTANNTIMLGNSSVTNVYSYGDFGNPSDKRLKENIVYKNNLGLGFILKLKTASYNYIADSAKHRRDGLIAQDVQQALTDLGIEFSGLSVDENADKMMSLSYGDFVIPLINAVQEQQKQIDLLKQQNELLLQMINELKK